MSSKVVGDFYDHWVDRQGLERMFGEKLSLIDEIRLDLSTLKVVRLIRGGVSRIEPLENFLMSIKILPPRIYKLPSNELETVLEYEWKITRDLIGKMAHFANDQGAQFLVYESTGAGNVSQPTKLKMTCDSLGVNYLNSFIEFAKVSNGTSALTNFNDFHWNKRGHKLAAKSIYKYLIKNKLIKY